MLIEEKFKVKSPIERVWDFLLDPKSIGSCIPGCEMVEQISDKEYLSTIKTKVGFFSFRFNIKSTIEEIVPYKLIYTVAKGDESGKKAHFSQKTTVNFNKLSEDETEVTYRADVSVVGTLATFGERIMRAKAKELGKIFADNVRSKLETAS